MIFLLIVIVAIGMYAWGHKISALVIFFFFITSGFNLIPEDMMENYFFSKGMDYAIITIIGMVIIDSFCIKNYWKPDKLLWLILVFYAFLILCVAYNKFVIGISWTEIIRTARYNVLWITAYLVFRNLSREQLIYLMKCLFWITVVCAILYLFQIVLNTHILDGTGKGRAILFGMKFPRFYNQPDMLQIFTFMAIYFNPHKGSKKILTTAILVAALLGAFHRSLVGAFFIAIVLGYIIQLPRLRRIKMLTFTSVFLAFVIVFAGYKFIHSRTYIDIQHVVSGNLLDVEIDVEDMQNSTFTFRMLHLLERNQYLLDNPKSMFLGAGLMTEDSKLTGSIFDFNIGLSDVLSEETVQLDSGDISYSILFLRYGYLGTLLVLALYIFLMVYFYKNHKDRIGLFSFMYLIVVIIISFFSQILTLPISFLAPLITYNIVRKNKLEYE
ncbi:MAG: hypothetical protein LBS54_09280 [Dysgonamonadaceae bacterium]|jgi:hypothetical protein|nr:hypothetical protein [Dysgonamonadaceae bacterium]